MEKFHKTKKNKKFILKYDKFVENKYGGCDVQRTVIQADTKDIAIRRMKNDLYHHGCYQGICVAWLPNGERVHMKPRKDSKLTFEEREIRSKVLSREKHHRFGDDNL